MAEFVELMKDKKAQFFPLRDDNPRKRFPFVNYLIIIANIVIFIFTLSTLEQTVSELGFVPVVFDPFTLLSSMFLHGGIAHIFGNMWFLFIFGDNIEDVLGHFKYVLFYFLSGLAATMTHYVLNVGSTTPAVGASGAISGVLGAYIVLFPKAGVYVSGSYGHVGKVSAKMMLGIWFIFQLISGTFSFFGAQSGIAFFAHVGGFVFGFLVAWIYRKAKKDYNHVHA